MGGKRRMLPLLPLRPQGQKPRAAFAAFLPLRAAAAVLAAGEAAASASVSRLLPT